MKIELIMKHLYPLSKKEFMTLHKEAWVNGWAYGPGFIELYDDYLVNWVFFVDYLDILIQTKIDWEHKRQYTRDSFFGVEIKFKGGKNIHTRTIEDLLTEALSQEATIDKKKEINIFIGEAPPYWPGKFLSLPKDRSYFYNPYHTKQSPWFSIPVELYVDKKAPNKKDNLIELAKKGFLLFDIFPFPIIQDTQVRKEITGDFSGFLTDHFSIKYIEMIEYLFQSKFEDVSSDQDIKINHALVIPIYGCLQLVFGPNSRPVLNKLGIFDNAVDVKTKVSPKKWEIIRASAGEKQNHNIKILRSLKKSKKDRFAFISELLSFGKIADMDKYLKDNTPKIPMLIAKGGGLSLTTFINSEKNNS
jgi:hypothetical protein